MAGATSEGLCWSRILKEAGRESICSSLCIRVLKLTELFFSGGNKILSIKRSFSWKVDINISYLKVLETCWCTELKIPPGVIFFFNRNASQAFLFNNQMETASHLFCFCLNLFNGFCIINWKNIVNYNWAGIFFQGRCVFLFPYRGFSFHSIFMCCFFKSQEGMYKCVNGNI